MALDFGNGVSRTLNATARQFAAVVWQKNKPPLDSELNLMAQADWEALRQAVKALCPSGFFVDPTRTAEDFRFDPNWVNLFRLGVARTPKGQHDHAEANPPLWANVNGWVVPVSGTNAADGDLSNVIKLLAPPETNSRIDFVFLEVWQARVNSNPSTANKPSASTIWKYGNVSYGGTNIVDDLEDPTIGYATTGRIQVQHRLRVVGGGVGLGSSVALDVYPDGLGDPNIHGQGTAGNPVAGLGAFANMREALGDASLWRAGDGNPDNDFGTVDGYVYAIPVCAIFRRGSNPYVAVQHGGGNPTQNGSFARYPAAKHAPNPTAKELTAIVLDAPLSSTALQFSVTGLAGSGLDDPYHTLSSVFLVLDDEIIGVESIDLVHRTITVPAGGRGRWGTAAVGHTTGTVAKFYTTRPDGLYADQIAPNDVLDLRHTVSANDWDYDRLLAHNVATLAKGELKTTWKQAGTGGDTQGVTVHEVDYLYAGNGANNPNYTEPVDGPDGIRTVWSDAATIQPDVTLLLDNEATQDNGQVGLTNAETFDATVAWDVGADFHPSGFMNSDHGATVWSDGTTILLCTGGRTGDQGVRSTFRTPGTRGTRLLTPREWWKSATSDAKQTPVTMRFMGQRAFEPAPSSLSAPKAARHVGPMYPTQDSNFEYPFIVLGGILNDALKVSVPATDLNAPVFMYPQIDVGIDFDAVGAWLTNSDGDMETDPTKVANPLFHGLKTLYGMLTDGGRDQTGNSSDVYVILYGDKDDRNNNGAFKVVGVGTTGATHFKAANATSIVVKPLNPEFTVFGDATGNSVTVEFRSQGTHAEDTSSYDTKWADVAIVLTDVGGQVSGNPWSRAALGFGGGDGYDLSMPLDGSNYPAINSKLLLNLTFTYPPSHGVTARIADKIVRFARVGGNPSDGHYLRQAPSVVDTSFAGNTGAPTAETFWKPNHVQLWNRLPALGLTAPMAPNYGGGVVGYTEQDREHELFTDSGSKTAIFRPFRARDMTVKATTFTALGAVSLVGPYAYPVTALNNASAKDGLVMFTGGQASGKQMGYAVPPEYMPRFGRQDIPYVRYVGENPQIFMPGINHLFRDVTDNSNPVFGIIGGAPTALNVPAVKHGLFVTGMNAVTVHYGASGTTPAGTNNQPFIGARISSNIDPHVANAQGVIDKFAAVNSSDFGRGLEGIQLPPCYGIARLYGVYDARDFVTKGGRTIDTNDRYRADADPAPNLLREDADKQTLFIMRDGATDLTGAHGYHTYVVPSNVLDLSRCLQWDAAHPTAFKDMHFVVVCTVFGFARDWINGNNFVLARKYDGKGLLHADGDNTEIDGLPCVLPCPAGYEDQFYVAYNRTVYQGDTYMSRHGTAKTSSDYEVRYGQLTSAQQYALRWPIQQYDASGGYVPQTPSPRAFQVLASLDFYTTLGTGKVGGKLYAGTPLDVGYTENSPAAALRKPDAADATPWSVKPRAFTEGQVGSESRATFDVVIVDHSELDEDAANGRAAVIRFDLPDGAREEFWFAKYTNQAALHVLAPYNVPTANMLTVDQTAVPSEFVADYVFPGGTAALIPNAIFNSANLTVAGAQIGDTVLVEFADSVVGLPYGIIELHGRVTAMDTVVLTAVNHVTATGFQGMGATDTGSAVLDVVAAPVNCLANSLTPIGDFAFAGVALANNDVVVVTYKNEADVDDLTFVGVVHGNDTVRIYATNPTGVAILWGGNKTLRVAVLEKFDVAGHTYPLANKAVKVRVLHTREFVWDVSNTVAAAVTTINDHPIVSKWVKASAGRNDKTLHFEAKATGAEGNLVRAAIRYNDTDPAPIPIETVLAIAVPSTNAHATRAVITASHFVGGVDSAVNGGNGTSQVKMTGLIERLPTGALLQDSDFLCENPLGDTASAFVTLPSGPRPIQVEVPFTQGGEEYTRFLGAPGELIGQSDGAVAANDFSAWRQSNLTGSRVFRLYRGGGPLFVLGGEVPGGPVDWVSGSFPAASAPVLKGGVLACRAMLVRNFYEEVKPSGGPFRVTDGDEIQMVVATYGVLGDTGTTARGVTLGGAISPAGYGEGYAASDRYRCQGRPMYASGYQGRETPDPAEVTLAVYPDGLR